MAEFALAPRAKNTEAAKRPTGQGSLPTSSAPLCATSGEPASTWVNAQDRMPILQGLAMAKIGGREVERG